VRVAEHGGHGEVVDDGFAGGAGRTHARGAQCEQMLGLDYQVGVDVDAHDLTGAEVDGFWWMILARSGHSRLEYWPGSTPLTYPAGFQRSRRCSQHPGSVCPGRKSRGRRSRSNAHHGRGLLVENRECGLVRGNLRGHGEHGGHGGHGGHGEQQA